MSATGLQRERVQTEQMSAMEDGNDAKWKGRRKDRDDTPSVIRNVGARAQMVGPGRSADNIPVLSIPASIRLWQKVRWPLFVTVVLVILVAVGFFTNDILVARSVEQRIKDASMGEKSAHVVVMLESNRILQTMAQRYSGRMNVQAAYAWNSILISRVFGEEEKYLKGAGPALDAIARDSSSDGYAARIGHLVLKNDVQGAGILLAEALSAHPKEPRVQLTKAWVQVAQNDVPAAVQTLEKIRADFPDYLPPLYTLIEIGIQLDDTVLIARYSQQLLAASTGNLYGALTSLLVSLPGWKGEPLTEEEVEELAGMSLSLQERIKDAPEKLQVYSTFLSGRVALELGDYRKAIRIFESIRDDRYNLNVLAWYGRALMAQKGPQAVLKLLDEAGENVSFELNDLRARCYLDRYRMTDAQQALQALSDVKGVDLRELNWILAVRNGDRDGARAGMPEMIGGRLKFVALEMYDILQRVGDQEGIQSLLGAMKEGAEPCATVLRAWHEGDVEAALKGFSEKDSCVAAFALRVMKTRYRPPVLAAMAALVEKDPNATLRADVDRALAIWKTDGRDAAVAILDAIVSQKPEAAPLRCALARAYMDMRLYEKGLAAVKGIRDPEAVAIAIQGWTALRKTKEADAVLAAALSDNGLKDDPAVLYFDLAKKTEAGGTTDIIEAVDAVIGRAGAWTSELAELRATAMNTMGARADADRYLSAMARDAIGPAGLDESWQVNHVIIRMNLRRGGKFVYKATEVILDMVKKKRIEDSEALFSHGVISAREGNARGAIRYFHDAVEIDPTYLPAFEQLYALGEMTGEQAEVVARIWPDFKFTE